MKLSNRMNRFGDEVFAALNDRKIALEKQGRKLYNLSIGTPDFETPDYLKAALIDAAKDSENWKYALRDIPEMKDAVCDYYRDRFGVSITPDMICSCNGTQEGMGHLGMVLCDEGDTVILPTPCYPVFIAGVKMAGAQAFYYPMTEENGFLPNTADIPEEVAKKARCMVVSLPSNPTGSVANDSIYDELIAFAKKYDIIIIHDNAYSDIIFDGYEGGTFLSHEGASRVGVEFFSLSKSFNLTGARISFLIGNPEIVAGFAKLRSQIDFGMFLPVQRVAIAALKGPREHVEVQRLKYQDRRDALCGGLRSIGWNLRDSHGSMFVWAPIPEQFSSSMDFCLEMLDKTGVICTPGSSFGPLGERYVRFALVLPPEKIAEAVAAIGEWWNTL